MYLTKRFKGAVAGAVLLLIVAPLARGTALYVDNDASGLCDGSSWVNAYTSLQDALTTAHAMPKPVEIRVAQGLYKPDQGTTQSPGDRDAAFRLISGVTVRGGYAGLGRSNPDSRNVDTYETVLSGDLNGDDPTFIDPCEPWPDLLKNKGDNSTSVVLAVATDRSAVLDGCVITSGSGNSLALLHGAGIRCIDASPTISNCVITKNAGGYWEGGAIAIMSGSPVIRDCTFILNLSGVHNMCDSPIVEGCIFSRHSERGFYDDGGRSVIRGCTFADDVALYCRDSGTVIEQCTFTRSRGLNARNSNIKIVESVFTDNRGGDEGAICCEGGELDVVDCEFSRNAAKWSGGAIHVGCSVATIHRCVFAENVAGRRGGAISTSDRTGFGVRDVGSRLTVVGCTFVRNESQEWEGGAVHLESDEESRFEDCVFEANRCHHSWGGGMHIDGASVKLRHCTFADNSASSGGGVESVSSTVIAAECVFRGNSGRAVSGWWSELSFADCEFVGNSTGGAISCFMGHLELTDCLLVGNRAVFGSGAIYCDKADAVIINTTIADNTGSEGTVSFYDSEEDQEQNRLRIANSILWNNSPQQIDSSDEIANVTYSNLQGGWPGVGNIDVDPLFVVHSYWDPNGTPDDASDDFFVEGDYHLKSQAGRWNPATDRWVIDDVTSPCIDAGNPADPVAFEPARNGAVVNMGAYGGLAEASRSISGIHATYGGGAGTPSDPYLIYTPQHLNTIGAEPNDWGKHFRLMAHVDLGAYTGVQFNAIGSDRRPGFTGVFDGNGYTIANFNYVSDETRDVGLFRAVSDPNAKVMNLGLLDPSVDGAGRSEEVGALVGSLNAGTVANCYVKGGYVMGISEVGGLVGQNRGTVTSCFAACMVAAGGEVGGLVGCNRGTIAGCYSGSTVMGNSENGGLAGRNSANGGIITDCYAYGRVIDAYVQGYGAGGLVGRGDGSVISCFWDMETSEKAESAGGTGLRTFQMQMAATFLEAGWDFIDETENGTEDIWWMDEGQGYPRLWWELISEN